MSAQRKSKMAVTFLFCMMILFTFSAIPATAEKIKIKKDGQELFVLSKNGTKAESGELRLEIQHDGNKTFLTFNDQRYVIKKKENKYKLYSPEGGMLMKVKVKPEKIKISIGEEDPNPWSLKPDDDKVKFKVKKGDTKIGKVHFYYENNKIKVKKEDGTVCCTMKSDRLRAAAVVCMLDELNEIEKLLLFSMLCVTGL